MSFYVTLPSDSSMKYFPENKISHYITRLPTPIELTGEWEVALSEFFYPHTWHNITYKNNTLSAKLKNGKMRTIVLDPGYYETIPDILTALTLEEDKDAILFKYNPHIKRVRIIVEKGVTLYLEDGLAQVLGFDPGHISCEPGQDKWKYDSLYRIDLNAQFKVMMLYTDIVEPQIVGDVSAPLLRIVNVTGQDGETVCQQFDRPHYLPVNRKIIDTIEIVIRTHTGELMPFEVGRSYVKLHFRQKFLS